MNTIKKPQPHPPGISGLALSLSRALRSTTACGEPSRIAKGGVWLVSSLVLTACATAPMPKADLAGPATATTEVAATSFVQPAEPTAAQAPATDTVAAAPAESTVIAIDPVDPTARIDLNRATAQTDLWIRVRSGFQMGDLDNDLVRRWEQWYSTRPEYVQRMTERGGRYMFHIVEELNRRNMPVELALLPFIESAYNPQAMSVARASGMWQFIPGTGRDYALKQNIFRDDRRDVLASTRAALDYLQMLHGMFNDWHLALAAYNWGQGNVQKAIANNQRAGLATDYASLRMPDETRNYVPKLQAVKNIVARPDAFSLTLPELKNHPYFLSVGIDRDIDIDRAAKLAGLPMDEFKALNPQMNKPVILAAGTPQVLLPYDNANQFVRALQLHKGALATWTAWVAPRTLKPAEAAAQVGMTEADLRAVNNIPPRMLVKAGSTLLVPRSGQRMEDVDEGVADNATLALAPDVPPLRRVSFTAGRKGESVAALARRYGLSATQVAAWNRTSARGSFRPGQAIVLLLPHQQAAPARTFAAAKPAGKQVAVAKARTGQRQVASATTLSTARTAVARKR